MVDLTFDLPINPAEPNSAKISVTGTIEQAVAKMEGEYPGWNATFTSQPGAAGGGGGSVSRIFEPDHYDCNVPGDEDALQEQIFVGIEYLRRLNDTAKNGPGPENCGRVSCSWNSAIIWCNNVSVMRGEGGGRRAEGSWANLCNCRMTLRRSFSGGILLMRRRMLLSSVRLMRRCMSRGMVSILRRGGMWCCGGIGAEQAW